MIRIKFILSILLFSTNTLIYSQCPAVPSCTQTAITGTNYTVNPGDVLCINSNYNSGTITIGGGIVIVETGGNISGGSNLTITSGIMHIASGGTLSKNVLPTVSSILNVCGAISGVKQINDKTTLNYYGSSNYSLDMRNGGMINNYSTTANVAFSNMNNVNIKTFNNYGIVPDFSMSQFNQPITINNIGGMMTVTASTAIKSATVINNTNGGTFNWNPNMIADLGTLINNAGGSTMNFTTGGTANKPSITNDGTINFSGQYYLAGGTSNNNGKMIFSDELRLDGGTLNLNTNSTTTVKTLYKNNGIINMDDHSLLKIEENITTWNGSAINLISGCATVMGSTKLSNNSINSTLLSNPNLNFCGSAPMQSGGCSTVVPLTVTDNGSGNYRITGIFACGISNFDYIEINGPPVPAGLNGYWRINKIGSFLGITTIDLIGSTFVTASLIPLTSSIQYDQSRLKLGNGTYIGYSGCTNPCAPLPVKLVSFKAYKESGSVKIEWQTIEEKDNLYYEIQRSTDGINYEMITTVACNKNSSSLLTYTQYDYIPYSGTSYYRLKQIDMNGSSSYSSISVVEITTQSNWVVYPNPSIDGSFIITSTFSENEVLSVTITDVTGNNVRYFNSEMYEQEMHIHDLSSGLYVVSIQTVSNLLSKKLIVR